jgi:hypothetical protein
MPISPTPCSSRRPLFGGGRGRGRGGGPRSAGMHVCERRLTLQRLHFLLLGFFGNFLLFLFCLARLFAHYQKSVAQYIYYIKPLNRALLRIFLCAFLLRSPSSSASDPSSLGESSSTTAFFLGRFPLMMICQ